MCVRVFQWFRCSKDIDGTTYLVEDYTLKCWEGKWLELYFPLVLVFGVVVVVIGYPAAVFYFLRKSHKIVVAKRREKQRLKELHGAFVVTPDDDKDNDDPLDEMTEAYVDRCYYWETVAMLRKFVLTAGLVIFRNGSTLQLLLGVFVSSFYLVARHNSTEDLSRTWTFVD